MSCKVIRAGLIVSQINCRALRVWRNAGQELVGTDASPGTVVVICFHGGSDFRSLGAEILFVNHAVLIDDKCFHAGGTINRGKCYDGETAGHFAINDVAVRPALRAGSLRREDQKIVAVEGHAIRTRVTRLSKVGTEGVLVNIVAVLMRKKAIALAFGAIQMLRVFPGLGVELIFGGDDAAEGVHRVHFISADATEENFFPAEI